MDRDELIEEVMVLQRIVQVARDGQASDGVVARGPPTAAEVVSENASASASYDAIVAALCEQKQQGFRLSQEEENFLVLASLGRTASAISDEDCPICFATLDPSDTVVMEPCGHLTCSGCMREHIQAKVSEAKMSELCCTAEECEEPLSPALIERTLHGPKYAKDLGKYHRFSTDAFLDGTGMRMICPERECQASFLVEHTSPRVVCPHCRHAFCAHCPSKPDWHPDSSCEKYQKWARENRKGDAAFEALLRSKKSRIKKCPKCKGNVYKPPRSDGGACNHMTCSCTHQWCWLCSCTYRAGHYNEDGPCHGKQFYDQPGTF